MEWVKAVGMPLVTLILGFVLNSSLNSRQASQNASLSLRQARDNDMRLNAEMMGRRIDADSALRKDMLNSILNSFGSYEPGLNTAQRLEGQILSLELLASNFQESLDLKPLFEQVRRRTPDSLATLRSRLEKLASHVNRHQLTDLSEGGMVEIGNATPTKIKDLAAYLMFGARVVPDPSTKEGMQNQRVCLFLGVSGGKRHYRQFQVELVDSNVESREVQVRLWVSQVLDQTQCQNAGLDLVATREIDTTFWVGLFDFPMISNTRLSRGERCSVSLIAYTPDVLSVALVYFPGSRARMNYDELIRDVVPAEAAGAGTKH